MTCKTLHNVTHWLPLCILSPYGVSFANLLQHRDILDIP